MIDKEDFITGEGGGSIANDKKSLSQEKGCRYEHGAFRDGKEGKRREVLKDQIAKVQTDQVIKNQEHQMNQLGPSVVLENWSDRLTETMATCQSRNGKSITWDRERKLPKRGHIQKAQWRNIRLSGQ